MNIADLCTKAHEMAVEKGWWDDLPRALEIHALIHSEVAEATESWRNAENPMFKDENGKPCGELSEMADIVIRVADWCGRNRWDLESAIQKKMKYNATRSTRHGGKRA